MDRILNPRIEKQTIYEIYRACRLCGAGAGYKMPIIQNVVDLEGSEVELKQKIRECVQIEVNQDDKMPPLICELCVDKVNDFYDFLELCRQTNKRTRMRLGLPMQTVSKGSSSTDSGDCILGMTEPVYINDDSDGEPLAKHKMKGSRNAKKKEPEVRIKLESLSQHRDTRSGGNRSSRHKRVSPPRVTRTSRSSGSDNVALSRLQGHGLKMSPKSILKKEKDVKIKKENESSFVSSRLKRMRDKESSMQDIPVKRVKIAIKDTMSTLRQSRTSPKSRATGRSRRPSPPPARARRPSPRRPSPRRPSPPPSPAPTHPCTICDQLFKSLQGSSNHMRSHTVTYTNHKLACNACGAWFSSAEEAATHHRRHRNKPHPYTCPRCDTHFKQQATFDAHYNKNTCVPSNEVPDFKCEVCWKYYPTFKLYEEHKCGGEEARRGGKCSKCSRSYTLLKNLKKHESTCTAKKKGEVSPELLKHVKPLQVRVARCDPLLLNIKREHVDVSDVHHEYGLDRNCVYPYILYSSFRIKSEFSIDQRDGMVKIGDGIKDEFCSASFVHWDSDDESDSDTEISTSELKKPIESLSALTLKTIFSHKFLGKVPRRRRRVKTEKFDTHVDLYGDISKNIDSIIDNLGDDDDVVCNDDAGKSNVDLSIDFDNLLGDDKDASGGKEMSVDDTSKNDESAVSFDDLLKNDDDEAFKAKEHQHVAVKGDEKETDVEDTSKNDENKVIFDDLLKNDDQGSKAEEHQDDEVVKGDEKETDVEDTSKNDAIAVSFDDLLKNDDQISKTKNDQDDQIVKGDEKETEDDKKETEVNETNKNDASAVSFDDSLKNHEAPVSETSEKRNVDENVSEDVEMSEMNTAKVTDEIMETDDTPNNDKKVELSSNEKSDSSTDVKDGEKNSEVVINNDISNEQSNVISVNDNVDITEDLSKDRNEIKPNATDIVESEKAKETDEDANKMDISENNTSLENTDNEVPINDKTKEYFQSNDSNATDIINEQSTIDSNDTGVVNGEEPKSDELNNLDDVSDTEMDDKKLMEALDAQIGESSDKTHNNDQSPTKNEGNTVCNESQSDEREKERNDEIGEVIRNSDSQVNDESVKDTTEKTDDSESKTNEETLVNDNTEQINDRTDRIKDRIAENNDTAVKDHKDAKFNEKITLDDLISTRQNTDLKSLDLDNISDDDFNFDV